MIRFIFICLSLGCVSSFADSNYSKEIEKFAEALVFSKYEESFEITGEQKLDIKAKPISQRIKLTPCSTELTAILIGGEIKKRSSVKVICNGEEKWDLYVRVQVRKLIPLIVASKSLSKGQLLNETNMKKIYEDSSKVKNGVFSSKETLMGTRLKRSIGSKKSIRTRDICYVCKDDKVTITAVKSGLRIKASGIALSDGNIGATVRVKNVKTQRIVIGTVYALKEVHVTF